MVGTAGQGIIILALGPVWTFTKGLLVIVGTAVRNTEMALESSRGASVAVVSAARVVERTIAKPTLVVAPRTTVRRVSETLLRAVSILGELIVPHASCANSCRREICAFGCLWPKKL